MPTKAAMETRMTVVEKDVAQIVETQKLMSQNLIRLTEVAIDVAHIKATLLEAVKADATHQHDISGMGTRLSMAEHRLDDRIDKLDKETVDARAVTRTRVDHIVRVLIFIGVSVGTGVAGTIIYFGKKVVDRMFG